MTEGVPSLLMSMELEGVLLTREIVRNRQRKIYVNSKTMFCHVEKKEKVGRLT